MRQDLEYILFNTAYKADRYNKQDIKRRSNLGKIVKASYGPICNSRLLTKILRKNVGRPWSDIYREITTQITKPEQRNALENTLYWLVYSEYGDFTIDVNGNLISTSCNKKWKYTRPSNPNIKLGNTPEIEYHRIDGIWYEIKLAVLAEIIKTLPTNFYIKNKIDGNAYCQSTIKAMILNGKTYGYPLFKRQLNSKEIKCLNLQ